MITIVTLDIDVNLGIGKSREAYIERIKIQEKKKGERDGEEEKGVMGKYRGIVEERTMWKINIK